LFTQDVIAEITATIGSISGIESTASWPTPPTHLEQAGLGGGAVVVEGLLHAQLREAARRHEGLHASHHITPTPHHRRPRSAPSFAYTSC
jgi:hypothetical protein